MSHEGWGKGSAGDCASSIKLIDPCFSEIGVASFFLRTHRHEEFAELLITVGAHQEVLSEAIVQSPAFDADGLGPAFPEAEHLGLWCAFVGVGRRSRIVNANVRALKTLTPALSQGKRGWDHLRCIFPHESFSVTVRLNTSLSLVESGSTQK